MARSFKQYAYYDRHGFVMEGTKVEIAEKIGIKESTVSYYCSPAYRNRIKGDESIRIYPLVEEPYYIDNVDVLRIKALQKVYDYQHKDIAEWLGISPRSVSAKMTGESRFNVEEVHVLEDMLYLEEGELILESIDEVEQDNEQEEPIDPLNDGTNVRDDLTLSDEDIHEREVRYMNPIAPRYYVIDREGYDYIRFEDGTKVHFSEKTKAGYEKIYSTAPPEMKRLRFELIPQADNERIIDTYEGGVNSLD